MHAYVHGYRHPYGIISDITKDYVYDANGQLLSNHTSRISGEWYNEEYEEWSELITDDYADYAYDENGNRTSTSYDSETHSGDWWYWDDPAANNSTYATGDNNQMTSDGTYTYVYDKEGNLKSKSKSGEFIEYRWDYRNRLTHMEVRSSEGSATVTFSVDYGYDALNRRISRKLDADGGAGGSAVTEFEVYEDKRSILSLAADGDVQSRRLWADQIDQLMAEDTADGTFFFLNDYQGSTRDVMDHQGNLVNTLRIDDFGIIQEQTSGAPETTLVWAGLVHNGQLDQWESLSRLYDPRTGRWTQIDPINFDGGQANLYVYCGNGPTNHTDRTGLDRRIGGWFFAHGYIEIRRPSGSTCVLQFGPGWMFGSNEGYYITGPMGGVNVTGPWIPSTPAEDQMLIDLWIQLEADRRAGRGSNWNGPWNCWGPVIMFNNFGMKPRPPLPLHTSEIPGWGIW